MAYPWPSRPIRPNGGQMAKAAKKPNGGSTPATKMRPLADQGKWPMRPLVDQGGSSEHLTKPIFRTFLSQNRRPRVIFGRRRSPERDARAGGAAARRNPLIVRLLVQKQVAVSDFWLASKPRARRTQRRRCHATKPTFPSFFSVKNRRP
jgi:hypothetical protein